MVQYFTKDGLQKLKDELHELKTTEMRRIVKLIAEAAASNFVPGVQPIARAYSPASSSARADVLRAESSRAYRRARKAVARPTSIWCRNADRIPDPADSPQGTSDRNVKLRVGALVNIHKILVRFSSPTTPRQHNVSAKDTDDTSSRRIHHVTRS